MNAWHFVGDELEDESPIPPNGEWLVYDDELIIGEHGLHASKRLIDALMYSLGNIICRVEVGGKIVEDSDRLVAEKRKILWRIDGNKVLKAFTRWCALQVAQMWNAPDVVIKYLETGDETYWDDAKLAIEDAPIDLAANTSWSSSEISAWEASQGIGRGAACDIARYTSICAGLAIFWGAEAENERDEALDMVMYAQNKQLERMVYEARDGKTEWIFKRKTI